MEVHIKFDCYSYDCVTKYIHFNFTTVLHPN